MERWNLGPPVLLGGACRVAARFVNCFVCRARPLVMVFDETGVCGDVGGEVMSSAEECVKAKVPQALSDDGLHDMSLAIGNGCSISRNCSTTTPACSVNHSTPFPDCGGSSLAILCPYHASSRVESSTRLRAFPLRKRRCSSQIALHVSAPTHASYICSINKQILITICRVHA
ncbi:hypothetical protein EDC01DRAFT_354686 [Geopyxis carbonaria]|nr:hypothetical protein EDC01DRAFT_354686 [Geopyxis carbonaria]